MQLEVCDGKNSFRFVWSSEVGSNRFAEKIDRNLMRSRLNDRLRFLANICQSPREQAQDLRLAYVDWIVGSFETAGLRRQ